MWVKGDSEWFTGDFALLATTTQSPILPSPLYTLLIPLRIMPYTDGHSWARREGYQIHEGIREGDEITDDESDHDDM